MEHPDLFPGFEATSIDVGEVRIFARVGGPKDAPAVVLVHGFPQTHVMWHPIAGELARHFRVIAADLRGYGWSSVPEPEPDHAEMSKRRMGDDVVRLMEALGHVRFALVGHDRGARVGYRLALDRPERLTRIALLDILPTMTMWEQMDATLAMRVYHWLFLAQPAPLPETMVTPAAVEYLEFTLASWTKARNLSAFSKVALADYRASFVVPERIAAFCEDYRAGAGIDLAHDRADRAAGKSIDVPTLALWGAAGIPANAKDAEGAADGPLAVWRAWCRDVEGAPIDAGHFVVEENAAATLAALVPFLQKP
jgi:haloacetate dehalogenase